MPSSTTADCHAAGLQLGANVCLTRHAARPWAILGSLRRQQKQTPVLKMGTPSSTMRQRVEQA